MTNEQIEAARERLVEFLDDVYNEAPEIDTDEPTELIDALCAAARQPESLVGRRVKLLGEHETVFSRFGVITDGPLDFYRVDTEVEQDIGLLRSDFELLGEPDDK